VLQLPRRLARQLPEEVLRQPLPALHQGWWGVSGTTVVDDRTGTGTGTGTGSDEQLQQLRRQRYSAATQDGGDGHNGERISPHCHPGRRAGARIQVFFLTLFWSY
jgi:hypothetical protein